MRRGWPAPAPRRPLPRSARIPARRAPRSRTGRCAGDPLAPPSAETLAIRVRISARGAAGARLVFLAPMAACPALDDEGIESPVSAAPAPGGSCPWCGRGFTASATRLRGRTLCARCGAASSDPVSGEELDRAYAGWYRPDEGRFSGPGDALLRRSRGHLAR